MAIDTAKKRRSAVAALWATPLPVPDGTIDAGDRAQIMWQWRGGFDASTIVVPFGALTGTAVEVDGLTGSVTD